MAREAIESLFGVGQIFMSGTRATFTLNAGVFFDAKAVEEALSERKLRLQGFRMEYRSLPAVAWRIQATGLG